MKQLQEFKNTYKPEHHIIVCGTGESLNDASQQTLNKYTTIGTNDIARFRETTYTVYPDAWWITEMLSGKEMAKVKKNYILNFTSDYLFLTGTNNLQQEHGYSIINDFSEATQKKLVLCNTLFIKICKDEPVLETCDISVFIKDNTLVSSYATHMAFSLAYYMGSRNIGFIGFDFSDTYAKDNNNNVFTSKCVTSKLSNNINNFNKLFFKSFPDVKLTNYSSISNALEGICEYIPIQ